MPGGRPVSVWTPRRLARLRWYAGRGLSQAEAAKLLDVSYGSVLNAAAAHGISFAGPAGAPRGNRNRHVHDLDERLQKAFAAD